MINKLIEKYKEKIQNIKRQWGEDQFHYHTNEVKAYESILQDLEELKVEIDKLAKDKNFFENYYYDDMHSKGKISKKLYAKFKGLEVDTNE